MSDKSLIEAALFVAGDGLSVKDLEKVTGLEPKVLKDIVEQLQREYMERDSGMLIDNSGKGYVMRVKPEFEEKILPLIPEADLPKSMLKTLALVAYEQPIKQSTVVKMRGNRVYHYMKRLTELGFVKSKPDGRTKLLSTTDKFKEYFKIDDLKKEVGVVEKPAEAEQLQQTVLELPPESQETQ